MPLTLAKCTNCGATLEVENTKDACICPYCKSAFIVEKAINNYNITNNITAGTVNIFGGNSADFVIRAGTLEKYNGASTVVVIPSSVTSIGENAFSGCIGLTEITIPNSVIYIGERAFQGCSGLTEITIPSSVTSIGAAAFKNCSGLTEITILNGMTSIGESAFQGCSGLTEITIPNSVTSIGESAFSGCKHLHMLTIENSQTNIITGNYYERPSFEFCDIETINAPEEWKKKYRDAFDCLKVYTPKSTNTYQTSGCYIATAVYGSYNAPEVRTLRRFRDEELQRTILGRAFIRTYCLLSPPVAKRLKDAEKINAAVRRILDKWVLKLEKRYIKNHSTDLR